MDAAAAALADLTEISSQVEAAALVDADGALLASTVPDRAGGERLAEAGLALLEAAGEAAGGRRAVRLEVALRAGSIVVLCEAELAIVARTSPGPASGLVFYDLGSCLHTVAEARRTPKRRRRAAKKPEATADA